MPEWPALIFLGGRGKGIAVVSRGGIAQRGGGCPILGNIHGQVGRGSEQPDPVENVPAHCKGVG